MKNLVTDIIKILFEPFAVGALMAIISSLLFYRKKCTAWFLTLSGAVIFAVAWRIVCFPVMRSSRYSMILIFPALIFLAWFCLKFGVLLRRYWPESWGGDWRNLFCRLLPGLCVIGLSCACLGQILHFDFYGNWLPEIVSVYQKHASSADTLYVQGEERRLAFYAGKPMQSLRLLPDKPFTEYLPEYLQQKKNIPGTHYFFFVRRKGQPEPTTECLQLSAGDGSWKILARRFTSRRNNKEFILALFEPGCPNIEEWNKPIPAMPAENLYKRIGGFETPLSAQQQKREEVRFKKLGIKEYSDLTDKLFPYGVWLGMTAADQKNPPVVRLREETALYGKYSLYVDARSPRRPAGFNLSYVFKKYSYSFFVRGEGKSHSYFVLRWIQILPHPAKRETVEQAFFEIKPGKVYRIFGKLPKNVRSVPRSYYCPVLWTTGNLTLDQFSVVPLKENKISDTKEGK